MVLVCYGHCKNCFLVLNFYQTFLNHIIAYFKPPTPSSQLPEFPDGERIVGNHWQLRPEDMVPVLREGVLNLEGTRSNYLTMVQGRLLHTR